MRGVEQIPWLYDGVMSILELFGLRRWRLWLVGGARGGRFPETALRILNAADVTAPAERRAANEGREGP